MEFSADPEKRVEFTRSDEFDNGSESELSISSNNLDETEASLGKKHLPVKFLEGGNTSMVDSISH